jgi:hypothetical protein
LEKTVKMAIFVSIIVILYLAFFLSFAEDRRDVLYTLLMPLCVTALVASVGGLILLVGWVF